jgi:hypothetical protein
MELDANVARLVEKLGAAFAIDARGADRHRYVNALLAIAAFLNEIKPFDIYADRFAGLAAALNDLDDGIIRPVLLAIRARPIGGGWHCARCINLRTKSEILLSHLAGRCDIQRRKINEYNVEF